MLGCVLLAGCTGAPAAGADGGREGPRLLDGGASADAALPLADGGPTEPLECGDLRLSTRVYYGTLEPTYLPMTPGQIMAVGTFGGCSGLLITPTWVLTAAHCGLGSRARFCIGRDPARPDQCFGAARVVANPRSDMALVQLSSSAVERVPELVPVPILTEDLHAGWIGRTAEAAGYGRTETGSSGIRKFTAEPIVALRGDTLTIDGEGRRGVCFGDSGGPVMVVAGDGTVRVAGDLSNGDDSCLGRDNFTRVDLHRDWIESYTGPTLVDGAPCGDIDGAGRCVDGTALWCDGEELESARCAGACGWDEAARGFRCIEGPDPCGGVDGFGACEGAVARWCEGGAPRSRDCGACGETCRIVPEAGGVYCAPDPCGGLDYLGRCNGQVAEWCADGVPRSRDCAAEGRTCGWVDDRIGYFCR